MKVAASIALLFAMTTVAAAKPAPVEFLRSKSATAAIRSNADFNIGAAGATLERDCFRAQERDCFRAQEPDSRSGPFLCRFEPSIFAKVRLAQSCR